MRAKLDDTDTPTLDPYNDVERTGDSLSKNRIKVLIESI
jgi:hypothetical protein